jgi:hypothetical protein
MTGGGEMPAGSAKTKSTEGGGGEKSTQSKGVVSEQAFWDSFDKVVQGAGDYKFAKIANLRRDLDWSKEQFDNTLKNLRDKGVLQLIDGDTDYFTKQDIADSFTDENGFRFLNVMKVPKKR